MRRALLIEWALFFAVCMASQLVAQARGASANDRLLIVAALFVANMTGCAPHYWWRAKEVAAVNRVMLDMRNLVEWADSMSRVDADAKKLREHVSENKPS